MLVSTKKFLKKYFKSLYFFYKYLRFDIFIALLLNILVGLLDGIGLTMFLPLLNLLENQDKNPELGSDKIIDFIHKTGIDLNITNILCGGLRAFVAFGAVDTNERRTDPVERQTDTGQERLSERTRGVDQFGVVDRHGVVEPLHLA